MYLNSKKKITDTEKNRERTDWWQAFGRGTLFLVPIWCSLKGGGG